MGYRSRVKKPEKWMNVIPDGCTGNADCAACHGDGYVYDFSRLESGKDYSKSKRGRSITIQRTYYKQCPICDPNNEFTPLLDCPLCRGMHTNDGLCPYCDIVYHKLNDTGRLGYGVMQCYGQKAKYPVYEYPEITGTRQQVLRWIAGQIIRQCKPHKKENPQEFQFHPLARAYRLVLREVWA